MFEDRRNRKIKLNAAKLKIYIELFEDELKSIEYSIKSMREEIKRPDLMLYMDSNILSLDECVKGIRKERRAMDDITGRNWLWRPKPKLVMELFKELKNPKV